jgi:hypothetical protein
VRLAAADTAAEHVKLALPISGAEGSLVGLQNIVVFLDPVVLLRFAVLVLAREFTYASHMGYPIFEVYVADWAVVVVICILLVLPHLLLRLKGQIACSKFIFANIKSRSD